MFHNISGPAETINNISTRNLSKNSFNPFRLNQETILSLTLYHSSFRSNLFECVGRELIENMTNSSRSFITFRALPKPWNFSINNISTRNSPRNKTWISHYKSSNWPFLEQAINKGSFFSEGAGKVFQFLKMTFMWTQNCSWTFNSSKRQ